MVNRFILLMFLFFQVNDANAVQNWGRKKLSDYDYFDKLYKIESCTDEGKPYQSHLTSIRIQEDTKNASNVRSLRLQILKTFDNKSATVVPLAEYSRGWGECTSSWATASLYEDGWTYEFSIHSGACGPNPIGGGDVNVFTQFLVTDKGAKGQFIDGYGRTCDVVRQ